MPTLRTAMLGVIDATTNILGPAILDQTPNQCTIVVRTWAGGAIDAAGGYTDATTVLPQKHVIRQLKTREIAGSGGLYEMGDMIVEGIVPADPANPGVGFFPTQLAPVQTSQAVEVFYRIAGQHNGEYARVELRTWDTYSYDLVLRRRNTTPVVVVPDVAAGENE